MVFEVFPLRDTARETAHCSTTLDQRGFYLLKHVLPDLADGENEIQPEDHI